MYKERNIEFETEPTGESALNGSFPDRWKFNHEINDVADPTISYKIPRVGCIETRKFYMEDGSVYRAHETKPVFSKQIIDQTSLKTTAFITRDDEGYNRHHQIKELESGLPTILISRELKWNKKLSQARSAHNILKIGKYLIEQNDSLDQENVQARGISRGAMIGLGVVALSQNIKEYGLNPFYFSATAPCFPRKFRPSTRYATMPLLEVSSLSYHLRNMPLKALTHYPGSIDTDLNFAMQNSVALTNGDAGKFVKQMHPDLTAGYLLGYPDDVMGMGNVWEKDFKDFNNVSIDLDKNMLSRLFNGHLRVVSHGDMSNAVNRQIRLAEEIKNNRGNLKNIDFDYVSNARS